MIFDMPFYTEGIRSSLSHAGEMGVKEGWILLDPVCKGELRNSVPIAASQSRPTQSSLPWFTVVIIKTAVTVHQELKREAVACFTAHPSHLPQPAETPLQAQPVVLCWYRNTVSQGWLQASRRAALQNLFQNE